MCVVPAERNPATTAGETATPRLGPWGTCPFPAPDVQRLCTATARPGRRGHGGDVVVVGRRSSWVPSSMCVREKPEGLAFAVPMWARGYWLSEPVAPIISFSRGASVVGFVWRVVLAPRGRPPAFLAGASRPKPRRSVSVQSARRAAW
jgi:hypothetical protein